VGQGVRVGVRVNVAVGVGVIVGVCVDVSVLVGEAAMVGLDVGVISPLGSNQKSFPSLDVLHGNVVNTTQFDALITPPLAENAPTGS
jgi:hypothetical protein